ncbi:MAG: hypothetical protein QXL19_07665 [Ignisphaera sp.]
MLRMILYLVILIIILSIVSRLISFPSLSLLEQLPLHRPDYTMFRFNHSRRTVCPDTPDTHHIDFAKILKGVDINYVANVNLSKLNITRYFLEYAKLGLLVPIGLIHNGSVYELHMLPISEDDEENITSKDIYLCFPPRAVYPLFSVANKTSVLFNSSKVWMSIPVIGTGLYDVWVNIATPPPYADINLSISYIEHIDTVTGFVEIKNYSYRNLGAYPGSTYCRIECIFNYCYRRCDTYYYHVYRIHLHYKFFLSVSGEITDVFERVYESNFWAIEDRVIEWSHGKYLSFEPFGKISINLRVSRSENCGFDSNSSTKYCNIVYYLDHFSVNYLTRGLRIYNVDVYINNKVIDAVTGVEPINITVPHVKTTLSLKNNRFYIPIEFIDNTNICTYINAAGFEAKRCFGNITRKSFAGYVEVAYIVKDFEWRWGEIVDVPYTINISKKLYPPPYAPNVDLNKMFYGYLQEQVLRYVAKIIDSYSSQTPYRDFEAWVLATQIPVQMDTCSNVRTYMSLVEALQDGCGSGDEKADVLSRLLSNLEIDNRIGDALVMDIDGEKVAKTVIGYIDTYPDFYELTRCCALYTGGRYMVVYDTVQNNIFSVLDRFVVW